MTWSEALVSTLRAALIVTRVCWRSPTTRYAGTASVRPFGCASSMGPKRTAPRAASRVADVFVDDATATVDLTRERREVGAEHTAQLFGIEPRAKRGGSRDVGLEHRDDARLRGSDGRLRPRRDDRRTTLPHDRPTL